MSKPDTTLTRQQIEDCRVALIQMLTLVNPKKAINKAPAINELCNLAQLGLKFRRAA